MYVFKNFFIFSSVIFSYLVMQWMSYEGKEMEKGKLMYKEGGGSTWEYLIRLQKN